MSRRGTLIGFVSLCLSSPLSAAAQPTPSVVHVDPAPVGADIVDQVMRRIIAPRVPSAAEVVDRLLDETSVVLHDLEDADRAGPASGHQRTAPAPSGGLPSSPATRMLLTSKLHELTVARSELREQAAQMRAQLVANGLEARTREWDRRVARIEERFDRLLAALDVVRTATTPAARGRVLPNARALLRTLHEDPRARQESPAIDVGPTIVQDRPRAYAATVSSALAPAYVAEERTRIHALTLLDGHLAAIAPPPTPTEATACSYAPADLSATPDAPLTAELQDLAASLQYSPTKIFQYVSDEIAFQPYYGSLKGAMATLYSKAGNATDHASLMIALLRAANIPSRYVKGTVTFTSDSRLLRWLGAKTHVAARNILAMGQIPSTYTATGNVVQFTHVWVEACVPYGNYRGTGSDRTGHRWIPLDPSFKDATYQPGITHTTTLDYVRYMATRTHLLPHEQYAAEVETTIKALAPNFANNTLADVPYAGTPQPRRLDILPASLPYQVATFLAWDGATTADVATLPDSHRLKLEIYPERGVDAEPSETGRLLERAVILTMPDIALKRVTLSFKGVTTADQTALTNWQNDGNLASALPLINVAPVVKVDGVEQTFGSGSNALSPIALGTTTNRLTLRVVQLEGAGLLVNGRPITALNKVTYKNIQAANYHALFAYAFQASDRLLQERAARLLATARTVTNPNGLADDTEGELLHVAGLKYMRYVTDAQARISALDGGSGQMGNHLGLASTVSKVQYVLDEPFAIYRKGFLVDMLGLLTRNVSLTTGQTVWDNFRLVGHMTSAYESYIWQETLRTDAVSSVRGIQYARETGMPVLTIPPTTDPNAANVLCYTGNPRQPTGCAAAYYYSAGDKTTILGLLSTGYTVTAPRQLIQYQNWKGWVAIAEKNDTAAGTMSGSYLISGVYAGGYQTLPPGVTNPGFNFGFDPTLDTGWVSSLVIPTIPEPPTVIGLGGGAGGPGATTYSLFGGDPVNLVTGNLYHAERDLAVSARGGLPIVLERSYNARKAQDGPFGFGWTHTYNQVLVFRDDNANGTKDAGDTDGITSSVSWIDGTGSEKIIKTVGESTTCGPGPGATFIPPPGYFFTVSRNADLTYTIRDKNGMTYVFENVEGRVNARARLTRITDRNGNSISLVYTGTPSRLTAVRDDLNRTVTFTYDGTTGRIVQVQDWTGRRYQYAYDASGNLVSFKNPLAVSGLQPPVTYTYYAGGAVDHAMASYTLPRGNGMTFEYYANGRVFRHATTAGATTTFSYNDFRRETVVTNERGFTRRHFFDKNGNPTKIVQENGGELTYTYDTAAPLNRLTEKDQLGYVTTYAYDGLGNVTQRTLPSGGTIQYSAFTTFNQPQKIKDPRGNYTILQYDGKGNLLQQIVLRAGVGASITNPAAYVPVAADVVAWTINTYDAFGNLRSRKQVRDAVSQAGPTTTYTYDANSLYPTQVSRAGDKDGNGTIDAPDTATVAYDSLGRATTAITADWFPTTTTYDAVDRVVTATDALGQTRRYAYDANGNRVLAGISSLDTTTAGYDVSDRRVLSTDAAGSATVYAYDLSGNVTAVTNPDGFTLRFRYDALNRVVAAIDQEGQSVVRDLDIDGKPRTITDPNGNATSYGYYDSTRDGRLRTTTDALGRTTTYDYDANGNVTSVTDPAGRVSLTSYDELNRPTRIVGPVVTDPVHGAIRPVTVFTYNLLGFKTQVKAGRSDPGGVTPASDVVSTQMTYVWDDFGRKLRETDALGRNWSTTYDVNHRPVSVTDAKSQVTTFAYDPATRQLQTRTAGTHVTSYTRNVLGQVVIASTPEVTYTYTYDAAHRIASVRDSRANKTLTYRYSDGGLLNALEDSDGNRTDYVYDAVGRLAEIWAPTNDVASFSYDAGGRLVERAFANGPSTRYAWNADNTLAQVLNRTATGAIISQHDYTYDPVGNRITHQELTNGSTTPYKYVYDALSRLIEVRNNSTNALIEGYGYDILHNRTTKTTASNAVTAYVHDAGNQLIAARQSSSTGPLLVGLVYDANGSLTRKCEGGTVTATGTTCSGATVMDLTYDRLNRLVQATKTGLPIQTYAYDHEGRRVQKAIGTTATNYLYNGPDIHAQYAATWTATARFTHGGGTDTPLLRVASSVTQYFHQDGLGSVVAMTNSDTTVAGATRYDAWGVAIATTGTSAIYGYTGREPDETGLIHYRARYYDATLARFTQRDPAGLAAGINVYAYVANNPTRLTDPTGLTPGSAGAANQTAGFVSPNVDFLAGRQNLYRVDIEEGGRVGAPQPVDTVTTRDLAVNGIRQNLSEAAAVMAGQILHQDASVRSFTLYHVVSKSTGADILETFLDKFGITTDAARQLASVLKDVGSSGSEMRLTAFSRGGVVTAEAVNYLNTSEGISLNNISVQCNGCANNKAASTAIFNRAGINVNFYPHDFDPVPNIIGLNTADPVRVIGSILAVPFVLFGPPRLNPHIYP